MRVWIPLSWLLGAVVAVAAPWHGQWIVPAGADRPNRWVAYRAEVEVAGPVTTARARIAADTKYWLWINGALVVREGGLKRGPTPSGGYFDEVDLGAHVRTGRNTVAVLVWHFGRHGFAHRDSGKAGLVFEAEIGGARWSSDARWRARDHPAFGDTGEPRPNYRLAEANVRFDARAELTGWTEPGYDDTAWPRALAAGTPPAAPWGELERRPIPLWIESERRDYAPPPELPWVSDGRELSLRLPYNAQVHPWFRIDAVAGETVDLRTDNFRGGSEFNVRAEFVTRAGVQEFEAPGWMNGHAVHYRFPPGVRVLALGWRETGYAAQLAGRFACSDPSLEQLWHESARTLYLTMRDNYMDCPDRERAQWWGDVVLQLGQAFYALDRRSDALARKAMRELTGWQRDDGTLFSPVPAGNWHGELPQQMLASVGWFGLWTYYLHSGDRASLVAAYPAVRRYLALWEIGEDGLVTERSGGWNWGDWGKNVDMPVLLNGWYYLALRAQAEMARTLGAETELPEIERRADSIRANFDRVFWNGVAYRSRAHAGATDDRAQAIAVVSGLAMREKFDALREVLRRERHASPYFEKYVAEALLQMGATEDALVRLKSRYATMLRDEWTTLYEGWGVGAEGFGGGTYNHSWSGGPLTILSQYVVGVSPRQPGYAEFEVRPRLGRLSWAEATVPSAAGEIYARSEQTKQIWRLHVKVPSGTRAVLVTPPDWTGSAQLNGEPAEASTATAGGREFAVGPGDWVLQIGAGVP